MAGVKRSSNIINKLVAEVDKRIASFPDDSVTAICKEVGINKETYYYRKRVEQEKISAEKDVIKVTSSVKKIATEDLMREYVVLESRMSEIKKELAKRLGK